MRRFVFLLALFAGMHATASEIIRIEGPAHGPAHGPADGPAHGPVHARVFVPQGEACKGVAIISHGAGGSELGYGYLGQALSSLGYLALVPRHPESGREVVRELVQTKGLRDALSELISNPQAYEARFKDIDVVRGWAAARCPGGGKAILVGHSMGAATVMLEAGAKNRLGVVGRDGFDVYIALSPQGAGSIFDADSWSQLQKPVLSMTGTQDIELGSGRWQSRMEPYLSMPPGCKWLAVIDGANHMQLAGVGNSKAVEASVLRVIRDFMAALPEAEAGCLRKTSVNRVDLHQK